MVVIFFKNKYLDILSKIHIGFDVQIILGGPQRPLETAVFAQKTSFLDVFYQKSTMICQHCMCKKGHFCIKGPFLGDPGPAFKIARFTD